MKGKNLRLFGSRKRVGEVFTAAGFPKQARTFTEGLDLNLPCRVAAPQNLIGLIDKLDGPAFSTSVGLLHWARRESMSPMRARKKKTGAKPPMNVDLNRGLDFLKRLLP